MSRGTSSPDEDSFLRARFPDDDLAQEIGEAAVVTLTSGADAFADDVEALVDEEAGGPFVETSGSVEFAGGTDESNIAEATREPIPLANHDPIYDDEEGEAGQEG
jgi:hypothetical protein